MIFKSKITLESFLGYVKNFIYQIYRIKFDNILLFQFFSNFSIYNYSIYIYIHKITVRTFQYIYIYMIITRMDSTLCIKKSFNVSLKKI